MAVVVFVTRGLRVHLPPELYEAERRVLIEAEHWRQRLGRRAAIRPVEIPSITNLARGMQLHVSPIPFEAPWRACPLWLGIVWRESKPSPELTPMAADDREAREWLASVTKGVSPTDSLPECFHEVLHTHRGVQRYVGVHHVKSVWRL